MPGKGFSPKDPDRRAGHSKAPGLKVIHVDPTDQPALPTLTVKDGDDFVSVEWPDVTVEWWRMWADSPLSAEFTPTDWSELRDTARLHALFWRGDKAVAPELRLRVAKFGATPEDRARLRITFAAAEEADGGDPKPAPRSARTMYRGLKSVGGTDAVAGA